MRDLEVGKRIREVRRNLRLTQAQFGKRLGITKLSVLRYEAGRISRVDILDSIARLGGVTVGWLLHGDEVGKSARPQAVSRDLEAAPPIHRLLRVLDRNAETISRLPGRYKKRYQERADELIARLERELEEHLRLLETEHRLRKGR